MENPVVVKKRKTTQSSVAETENRGKSHLLACLSCPEIPLMRESLSWQRKSKTQLILLAPIFEEHMPKSINANTQFCFFLLLTSQQAAQRHSSGCTVKGGPASGLSVSFPLSTQCHQCNVYLYCDTSVAQLVKKPPAMWEDPLEKGRATPRSSILVWRIPCTV